ncbi:restriction endonuclease [Aquimarina aggregata]|uniref:Restriction endonuclease n=1 Tax=Aquimarina aggregata TaxID=1642818 RepID=A0A162ZDX2_9FLAO|nr:DEAD/DEAH box helicase family protein [Aquimarina aggregata]KZS39739.1 restriction endonuclease [Aquimarina aggregata]
MSNFQFLQKEFDFLYKEILNAERHTFVEPRYAALLCRSAMEKAIFWLYKNDADLVLPYNTKLGALLHNEEFKKILKQPSMFRELDVIRLTGNNAAHGKRVNQYEALQSLKNSFRFLSFISVYYSIENPEIQVFNETLIPTGKESEKTIKELKKIAENLQQELDNTKAVYKKQLEEIQQDKTLKLELQQKDDEFRIRKEARLEYIINETIIPELTSEKETRIQLIDLLLKEAGWDNLKKGRDIEVEVKGMPLTTNPSGIGYVDYVLWGKNGLPLAVVEAKNTLHSAIKGKHQAVLYADCLERQYGQRPIIYYSNGFETYIWDDTFYPDRLVQGFSTQEELQLYIDRRTSRKDIRDFKVNTDIVGRPYQLEAIQRVAENFVTSSEDKLKGRNRKALLVMATGSGKTRTSAALVDMFTKYNWVKRVLFLADRNALVTQAKNAFKEHLPHLSAIDLTKESEDNGTRVVFSTYPTIMNRIDSLKVEDERFYGVGHFDLIIIDEAHRSVYHKYKSIFDYFDSLVIGLTATPKKDIDINTYSLFEIEDDNPTFAYELNKAVTDGYLVPPKAIEVPLKFPLEGIKYKELSKKDKNQFENLFGDPTTGEVFTEEIDKNNLNKWLFNADTVDKVLDHLIVNGIKVSGGDKLGKTIIFAKNHKHAIFVEERFNKNYPEYSGTFLRVIDNYTDKAQDVLEKFCDDKEELEPQIAVSVDMMDTGVDAPRVVNLVFFKRVRSYTKYWQMIGRGTRLRPNLFGPNIDKEHFAIFDFCGNFEFFDEFPDGMPTIIAKSISQQIFETKLDIVVALRSKFDSNDDEQQLIDIHVVSLYTLVSQLNEDHYQVRKSWKFVKKYKIKSSWDILSNADINDILNHLSNLIYITQGTDELAKRFDLIVLKLQQAIINSNRSQEGYIKKIYSIAQELYKKKNIPAVSEKINTIKVILDEEFWQQITFLQLEKIREDIRSLLKFLDSEKQRPIYSNFEDVLDEVNINERDIMPAYSRLQSYKDRVENFVRKNKHHLIIDKLYKNLPITEKELTRLELFLFSNELVSKDHFVNEYGDQPLGKFIRSIIGLDIEVTNQLFSELIQSENLNANQITFINTIIGYLNKNGTIDKSLLTKPPFNEKHEKGIIGIFPDEDKVVRIISIIDHINRNADVG